MTSYTKHDDDVLLAIAYEIAAESKDSKSINIFSFCSGRAEREAIICEHLYHITNKKINVILYDVYYGHPFYERREDQDIISRFSYTNIVFCNSVPDIKPHLPTNIDCILAFNIQEAYYIPREYSTMQQMQEYLVRTREIKSHYAMCSLFKQVYGDKKINLVPTKIFISEKNGLKPMFREYNLFYLDVLKTKK